MKITKQTIKKNISLLPGFVLLLAIVLGCGQLTKPTRKDTPDFKFTVAELEKELDQNESAARTKYNGKTVAIRGKADMKMEMSVILVSPDNDRFPVQCFFNPSDRDSFQQIQSGKEYTLIGVFDGGDKGGANTISNCKLY